MALQSIQLYEVHKMDIDNLMGLTLLIKVEQPVRGTRKSMNILLSFDKGLKRGLHMYFLYCMFIIQANFNFACRLISMETQFDT